MLRKVAISVLVVALLLQSVPMTVFAKGVEEQKGETSQKTLTEIQSELNDIQFSSQGSLEGGNPAESKEEGNPEDSGHGNEEVNDFETKLEIETSFEEEFSLEPESEPKETSMDEAVPTDDSPSDEPEFIETDVSETMETEEIQESVSESEEFGEDSEKLTETETETETDILTAKSIDGTFEFDYNNNSFSIDYEFVTDGIKLTRIRRTTSNTFDGTLTIPEQIDGYIIVEIGKSIIGAGTLTKLILPDGVKRIDAQAFQRSNLAKIILPESIEEIGSEAFADTSLETIDLSELQLTKLEDKLFSNCEFLSDVRLPDSLTELGSAVFFNCDSLENVKFLPDSIISMGDNCFSNCEKLRTIKWPRKLSVVPQYCFYGCVSLISVDFSDLEEDLQLEWNVFENCDSLKDISFLPPETISMGSYCFKGCDGLTRIELPAELDTINTGVFEDCSRLESVVVGTSLKLVLNDAFRNCEQLAEFIYDEEQELEFYYRVFENTGFTSFKIGKKVSLTSNIFKGSRNLAVIEVSGENEDLFTDENGVLYLRQEDGDVLLTYPIGRTETTYKCMEGVAIGPDSFFGATNLERVELVPANVQYDYNYPPIYRGAFYGCSNLKEIVNLAKSNLCYGDGGIFQDSAIFGECENLKTAEVFVSRGPGVKAELNLGEFYQCSGLVSIKVVNATCISGELTGCNALKIIEIPDRVWEISEEAFHNTPNILIVCSEGSYAESYAIEHGYRYRYFGSESIIMPQKDRATLFIYDSATKEQICGAKVEAGGKGYETDEDGIVSLPATDEETELEITVTADGYLDSDTVQIVKNGAMCRIGLDVDKNQFAITSVVAELDDVKYDLLRKKLVVGYNSSVGSLAIKEASLLTINVRTNQSNCTNYKLVSEKEPEKAICECGPGTLGRFQLSMVKSGRKADGTEVEYSVQVTNLLTPGNTYLIVVETDDGQIASKKIELAVSATSWTTEQSIQKDSIKLFNNSEIKIGDDIPLIGGTTLKFGLKEVTPVELLIDGNGIIRISLNRPENISMNKYKETFSNLKKKAKNAETIVQKFGQVERFGAGSVACQGKICGYGEGNISELNNGKITVKVDILAEFEGKGGYKQYFMAGFVPINLSIEGNGKVKGDINGTVTLDNLKPSWALDGAINVSTGLTIGGGIGAGVEVNASGTGTLNATFKPHRDYDKEWLEASAKIVLVVGIFEKPVWESKKYTYVIHESGADKSRSISSEENGENIVYTTEALRPLGREYLSYSTGYQNASEKKMVTALDNMQDRVIIKAAVYPAATPKMVDVSGTKYLFWQEDIYSRGQNDRSAIVWAKSEDGMNWSSPVQLIRESKDNTADLAFDIFVDGQKIYITWQDALRQIGDEENEISAMQALSVRRAILNTITGDVEDDVCVTGEEGAYYMYPSTVLVNGVPYTTYVLNTLDTQNIFKNNTQHLFCSVEEKTTEISLPINGQIVNMETGAWNGIPYAICEMDTDGELKTDSDREIYAFDLYDGYSVRITENDVCDMMPVVSESGRIYWYQAGNLLVVDGPTESSFPIWEEGQIPAPAVFSVTTGENGLDSVLWESADPEAEDGSVAVFRTCQNEDGSWSNAAKIAETESTIASRVTAVGNADALLLAHLEGGFLEDGSMLKDLCVLRGEKEYDISVDMLDFAEADAKPGASLPLKIGITNHGTETVTEVIVSVDGQKIGTVDGLFLKVGESTVITAEDFVVPADLTQSRTFSVTVSGEGEKKTTDNSLQFVLGAPDLYLETATRIDSGTTWLDVNVWNRSSYSSSGTLKIHRGYETGDVIYEEKVPSVGQEAGYSYTFDLGIFETESTRYYAEVVSDQEENMVGDNTEFIYIGFGTGIDESEIEEPEEEIGSISVSSSVIDLEVGYEYQLSVNTDEGKKIEPGEVIWVSSDKQIASVDENGIVTAHRAGSAEIVARYGELDAICQVNVSGNRYETFSVQFMTQGGEGIAPIVGIEKGATIKLPQNVFKQGAIFSGWYSMSEGGEKIEGDTLVVDHSMTLYAHWLEESSPTGFWIAGISNQIYTGSAIKPQVIVYDGETQLEEKKDYTVSYKNNTKVTDVSNPKLVPTVTVTGKGNYTGKETATFKILAKNIEDDDILVTDIILKQTNKVQKPVPVVLRNGKKLKNKVDFQVFYPDISEGAYKNAGEYEIVLKGIGGYDGERHIRMTITSNNLISKASVGKIAVQTYTGDEIRPGLTVKYGKALLIPGEDYIAEYENNVEIGTAIVTIKGCGSYSGEKQVTFKIAGGSILKATVRNLKDSFVYTGKEITQECELSIVQNKQEINLKKDEDYIVSYQNNVDVGKAVVIFTGINGYSGTLKKTYKIIAYDIREEDAKEKLIEIPEKIEAVYAKGGSKPKPVIRFGETELVEGVDYRLSYKNNTAVNDGSDIKKIPTIMIAGRGNFKGSLSIPYTIKAQNISELAIVAPDKVYNTKKNGWKAVPVISDLDGKKLSIGKDYEKELKYTYVEETVLKDGEIKNDGDIIESTDILPAGTKVRVTAVGRGNYKTDISMIYRIVAYDISKLKVKVESQIYTGEEIRPGKDQITLKQGTTILGDDSYEIESYSNNVAKGTGIVLLRGVGNYGGTKKVKFTIKSKGLLWWWRNLLS